jgi:hypothetical protein
MLGRNSEAVVLFQSAMEVLIAEYVIAAAVELYKNDVLILAQANTEFPVLVRKVFERLSIRGITNPLGEDLY